MDSIQKQIIGYLLMAVVTAVVGYVALKFELWFTDPALLTMLGILLPALLTAALKWIKHTFNLPEDAEVDLYSDGITTLTTDTMSDKQTMSDEQIELLKAATNGMNKASETVIMEKEAEIEALKKQLEGT